MDITWVEPTQLKMDPENINEHSAEQLKRLAKLIQYQGWRLPIVVSKQDDLIKAGHGRVQAAIDYNLGKVPVSYQDFVSDEQAAAFRVSDNSIASWASLNLSKLNTQLPEIGPDFDVEMFGIKDFSIEPSDRIEYINRGDEKSEWVGLPEFEAGGKYIRLIYQFNTEIERELYCQTNKIEVEKKHAGQWIVYK